MDISVHWTAALVAGVVAFIIGFLWYGPVFGKQWIAMMKIPQSEVDAMKAKGMSAMLPQMVAGLVQQIIIAAVLSHLLTALNISDAMAATWLAVLVWFGFVAAVTLSQVLWEKRTIALYAFNSVYVLVTFVVMVWVLMWMA